MGAVIDWRQLPIDKGGPILMEEAPSSRWNKAEGAILPGGWGWGGHLTRKMGLGGPNRRRGPKFYDTRQLRFCARAIKLSFWTCGESVSTSGWVGLPGYGFQVAQGGQVGQQSLFSYVKWQKQSTESTHESYCRLACNFFNLWILMSKIFLWCLPTVQLWLHYWCLSQSTNWMLCMTTCTTQHVRQLKAPQTVRKVALLWWFILGLVWC